VDGVSEKSVVSAFSVDVEDGVSIAMRDVFGVRVVQTDRVVSSTEQILDMLGIIDGIF